MNRFDYLTAATGPVVEGLEDRETIFALEQMAQYMPIRTLPGDSGRSAIYRLELTDSQRQMVAEGADVLVEILHYGGPLAPSRVMLLNQRDLDEQHSQNLARWFCAQAKVPNKKEP
jgi:hypothetical protein